MPRTDSDTEKTDIPRPKIRIVSRRAKPSTTSTTTTTTARSTSSSTTAGARVASSRLSTATAPPYTATKIPREKSSITLSSSPRSKQSPSRGPSLTAVWGLAVDGADGGGEKTRASRTTAKSDKRNATGTTPTSGRGSSSGDRRASVEKVGDDSASTTKKAGARRKSPEVVSSRAPSSTKTSHRSLHRPSTHIAKKVELSKRVDNIQRLEEDTEGDSRKEPLSIDLSSLTNTKASDVKQVIEPKQDITIAVPINAKDQKKDVNFKNNPNIEINIIPKIEKTSIEKKSTHFASNNIKKIIKNKENEKSKLIISDTIETDIDTSENKLNQLDNKSQNIEKNIVISKEEEIIKGTESNQIHAEDQDLTQKSSALNLSAVSLSLKPTLKNLNDDFKRKKEKRVRIAVSNPPSRLSNYDTKADPTVPDDTHTNDDNIDDIITTKLSKEERRAARKLRRAYRKKKKTILSETKSDEKENTDSQSKLTKARQTDRDKMDIDLETSEEEDIEDIFMKAMKKYGITVNI